MLAAGKESQRCWKNLHLRCQQSKCGSICNTGANTGVLLLLAAEDHSASFFRFHFMKRQDPATIIQAFVTSRLYYCVMFCLRTIQELTLMQNAILFTHWTSHWSLFIELPLHLYFQICMLLVGISGVLSCKGLNGLKLSYMKDCFPFQSILL